MNGYGIIPCSPGLLKQMLTWGYRRLTRDLNLLVVAMLEDGCSPINCPEMRTLDCQYLCATHEKPKECPATDYIIHTLDYTTALLNSSKLFPSRYHLTFYILLRMVE
jgi:Mob1/phocein family